MNATLRGITIDAAHSTDLDDALWAERVGDGYKVLVTIAGVAHEIAPGTRFDEDARRRIVTRYYPGGHSSMLPRGAEERLSLLPGLKRRVAVVELALNAAYEISGATLAAGAMESKAKVNHDDVPTILATPGHALHEQMKLLMAISSALMNQRRARGAFVLYDLTHGWIATEEGHVKRLERAQDAAGHIIVQELMIAANQAVADYAFTHGVPVLFRVHQVLGLGLDRDALIALLGDAAERGAAVGWLEEVRRQTGHLVHRAEYSPMAAPHFGLNLTRYLHFTSPIRRYADFVTQRQILAHVSGRALPYTLEQIAEVAAHINSTLALQRDEDEARAKERATKEAQRAIDGRRVDALDGKSFERVVKVAVRSGEACPEAFAGVFLRRVADGRASLLCRTLVLLSATATGAGWSALRQAIVERLTRYPQDAVSVLTTAGQVLQGWPTPTWDVEQSGQPHLPSFVTTWRQPSADGESTATMGIGRGRSAREATQRGAVALLAALAGCEAPTFPEAPKAPAPEPLLAAAPAPPDPRAPLVAAAPMGEGKDAIMQLQEVAQAKRTALPSYAFKTSGESHAPTILCTCWYQGKETRGSAGKKQDAKREAASAMLVLLSGKREGMTKRAS